jgi:hypothetical protein
MAYPTYNWTGIYLGLNGGGGWGSLMARLDAGNLLYVQKAKFCLA